MPARFAAVTRFCVALIDDVTTWTLASRRWPIMPTGSRMPSCASTRNSCGQDVEHFAIFGKRDVARRIDGAANIVAFDVARAVAEGNAAAAVHAAHEAAGDADKRRFDRNVRNTFGLFDRASDRTDCGVEVYDQALAQALRFRSAQGQKLQLLVLDFRDQRTRFRAADIEPDQKFVLLRQTLSKLAS